MILDRRLFLTTAAALAASAMPAVAQTKPPAPRVLPSAFGLDAATLGLKPNSDDDQSAAFQRAVNRAAEARVPLALPPGRYRVAGITLPAGAHLVGPRGQARLIATSSRPIVTADSADGITLDGLVFDGAGTSLPDRAALVMLSNGLRVKIADCEITASGRNGLMLDRVGGDIVASTITDSADVAIQAYDGRGLTIARCLIRDASNAGIQILRGAPGEDGTIVVDNRIEAIKNRAGGTGQHGNGVNAFRAGNVIVRGNQIHGCAFSAVRGNSADNIQIVGNTCSDIGEVALYSEFSFLGAVIASNSVTRAQTGVSVCNFNEGGRLATVTGNVLRDFAMRIPGYGEGQDWGIGIYVEADTAVTGNVVEQASAVGILAGWGRYLRDVAITGNVVRQAAIGIGVSAAGAGSAVVSANTISGTRRGAVVGLDHLKPVTGDLTRDEAARPAHLAINGNKVS